MEIIHFQEGYSYSTTELVERLALQSGEKESARFTQEFIDGWVNSMNESLKSRENGSGPVKVSTIGQKKTYQFDYVGLYNYTHTDDEGTEITLYFAPKFLKAEEEGNPEKLKFGRDKVLLAIDRYFREQVKLWSQEPAAKDSHLSRLGLAVQVLRDYLENGLYIINRHELETNGNGEIDWEATIDRRDPFFSDGNPVYVDCLTSSALPDENHYITRLHKCLITTWGRKFEELGLSSVLRVNVPTLSDDDLTDAFGEKDSIVAEIRKELSVQFVTKSRWTLQLMAALVEETMQGESLAFDDLSFGMSGAEHLWEKAVKVVFQDQMDRTSVELGLQCSDDKKRLKDFIEPPIWKKYDETVSCSEDEALGSRLRPDFIAVEKTEGEHPGTFMILDAKYYLPDFEQNGRQISGCPGVGDIDKQFLYQFAYAEFCAQNNLTIRNAFVFPFFSHDRKQMIRPFATVTMDLFTKLLLGKWIPQEYKDIISQEIETFKVDGIDLLAAYADGRSLATSEFKWHDRTE